jgi:16S rRNA (cytidine1402-2'-O)-methyltransferase
LGNENSLISDAKHTLYVVATPIGNRDDLSLRAISTLQDCHCIYAEDTRHSRPLLHHHGINTQVYALHEHNESARAEAIVAQLQNTGSVALISDAGTPLISDPGYRIVRAAQDAGIPVSPVPGASAMVAALSVAGLPTDRFLFAGFPPNKSAARINWLSELADANYTVVLYESPHRILATLHDISTVFSAQREITLARELTKRFETVLRGRVATLLETLEADPQQQRGEFVLLISGVKDSGAKQNLGDTKTILTTLLKHMPLKTAAKAAAELTGIPRKQIYELGVSMSGGGDSDRT